MSTGASGSDEKISASKIEPLASDVKTNVPHDQSSRGVVGTDRNIDQSRIDPIGGKGQYQHPAPADHSGSVGKDETIQGAKIEPLEGKAGESTGKYAGIGDEEVSGSRIPPIGSVREEQS